MCAHLTVHYYRGSVCLVQASQTVETLFQSGDDAVPKNITCVIDTLSASNVYTYSLKLGNDVPFAFYFSEHDTWP